MDIENRNLQATERSDKKLLHRSSQPPLPNKKATTGRQAPLSITYLLLLLLYRHPLRPLPPPPTPSIDAEANTA